MSTLIRYHHDGETPEFIAAVNEDMALLAANRRPQPVDWRAVGHRAVTIVVTTLLLYAILACALQAIVILWSAVHGDVYVHVPASTGATR